MTKRKELVFALITVALCFCNVSTAFGSLGGRNSFFCGNPGTVYTNLRPTAMNIELKITFFSGCGGYSVSWTDADGNARTISLTAGQPGIVSSSLPANGVISWSSSSPGTNGSFDWQLEQAPAVSISGFDSGPPMCVGSGTIYTNLTNGPIDLNFDLGNGSTVCLVQLSWLDSGGMLQGIVIAAGNSQGISTSLPPNGTISWMGLGISEFYNVTFTYHIERAP